MNVNKISVISHYSSTFWNIFLATLIGSITQVPHLLSFLHIHTMNVGRRKRQGYEHSRAKTSWTNRMTVLLCHFHALNTCGQPQPNAGEEHSAPSPIKPVLLAGWCPTPHRWNKWYMNDSLGRRRRWNLARRGLLKHKSTQCESRRLTFYRWYITWQQVVPFFRHPRARRATVKGVLSFFFVCFPAHPITWMWFKRCNNVP